MPRLHKSCGMVCVNSLDKEAFIPMVTSKPPSSFSASDTSSKSPPSEVSTEGTVDAPGNEVLTVVRHRSPYASTDIPKAWDSVYSSVHESFEENLGGPEAPLKLMHPFYPHSEYKEFLFPSSACRPADEDTRQSENLSSVLSTCMRSARSRSSSLSAYFQARFNNIQKAESPLSTFLLSRTSESMRGGFHETDDPEITPNTIDHLSPSRCTRPSIQAESEFSELSGCASSTSMDAPYVLDFMDSIPPSHGPWGAGNSVSDSGTNIPVPGLNGVARICAEQSSRPSFAETLQARLHACGEKKLLQSGEYAVDSVFSVSSKFHSDVRNSEGTPMGMVHHPNLYDVDQRSDSNIFQPVGYFHLGRYPTPVHIERGVEPMEGIEPPFCFSRTFIPVPPLTTSFPPVPLYHSPTAPVVSNYHTLSPHAKQMADDLAIPTAIPTPHWHSNSGPIPYRSHGSQAMEMSSARRRNATRESTATLKSWLQEHIKNPYPTKGEKIMLAIITKMTLTQVSTWFANARRRLKKENKMTWTPRHRGEDLIEEEDEADDTDGPVSEDGSNALEDEAEFTKTDSVLRNPGEDESKLTSRTTHRRPTDVYKKCDHENKFVNTIVASVAAGKTPNHKRLLPNEPVFSTRSRNPMLEQVTLSPHVCQQSKRHACEQDAFSHEQDANKRDSVEVLKPLSDSETSRLEEDHMVLLESLHRAAEQAMERSAHPFVETSLRTALIPSKVFNSCSKPYGIPSSPGATDSITSSLGMPYSTHSDSAHSLPFHVSLHNPRDGWEIRSNRQTADISSVESPKYEALTLSLSGKMCNTASSSITTKWDFQPSSLEEFDSSRYPAADERYKQQSCRYLQREQPDSSALLSYRAGAHESDSPCSDGPPPNNNLQIAQPSSTINQSEPLHWANDCIARPRVSGAQEDGVSAVEFGGHTTRATLYENTACNNFPITLNVTSSSSWPNNQPGESHLSSSFYQTHLSNLSAMGANYRPFSPFQFTPSNGTQFTLPS
ncbi:unnamed protein product [Dicrocoelium dendriticum]|nr:unnamed protein product [Dicrocoelium dendriticum]